MRFLSSFKSAIRRIGKQPVLFFINILGLTISMLISLVAFINVYYELGFDSFYKSKESIFRVISEFQEESGEKHTSNAVPVPTARAFQGKIPNVIYSAGYNVLSTNVIIKNNGKESKFEGSTSDENSSTIILTDQDYLKVFGYKWLAGSPTHSLNAPFQVVITDKKAEFYFHTRNYETVLGKEIIYRDSLRVFVSGIVKGWEGNSDFAATDFISSSTIEHSFLKSEIPLVDWGNGRAPSTSQAIMMLNEPKSRERATMLMNKIVASNIKLDRGTKFHVALQKLSEVHFDATVEDGLRKSSKSNLILLFGIALFIFMLAVINYVNLFSAQIAQQSKDFAVRKILGTGKTDLFIRIFAEIVVLSALSALLALALIEPVFLAFNAFFPPGIELQLISLHSLVFFVGIIILTSILAGFYPVILAKRITPLNGLLNQFKWPPIGRKSTFSLRKTLIVFQFFVSLTFISLALVMYRQIKFVKTGNLGFKSDGIILINTDPNDSLSKLKLLSQRIRRLAGVKEVAAQSFEPLGSTYLTLHVSFKRKNVPPQQTFVAGQFADTNFIPLYQMTVLAGRNLRASDSLNEFVVNQEMSKSLGFQSYGKCVGSLLFLGDKGYPVVGVVEDFHQYSYHEMIKPMVIGNIPKAESSLAIKLDLKGRNALATKAIINSISEMWKETYPEAIFDYRFLDEAIASLYEAEMRQFVLLRTGMLTMITISTLGLIGLLLFTATSRRKELAIRKVLGATSKNIAILLASNIFRLIAIATLISAPVAWLVAHRWLDTFAYRSEVSIWLFILSGVFGFGIALISVGFQIFKVSTEKPMSSLKVE